MIVGMPANEFVVFDVETTGLDPRQGEEIIEIGAQKLRGREVIDQFVQFVTPTRPVTPEVQAVHGITPEMLQLEGQPHDVVIPKFVDWIGSAILIGHNIPFDLSFLNAHRQRLGHDLVTNQTIDTLEIAKRYLILSSYSLKSVAAFLKIPQPKAHRALADVETTREVFFKLLDRAKQK